MARSWVQDLGYGAGMIGGWSEIHSKPCSFRPYGCPLPAQQSIVQHIHTEYAQPAGNQEDHPLQLDTDVDEEDNLPATQHTAIPAAAIPLMQKETPAATAQQTRSGRVIKNTPQYDQSISLRDKGIVA